MQYALDLSGRRIPATKAVAATCPGCGASLVAKAVSSQHVVAHWAHVAVRDCDPWYEPETLWHRTMKSAFPEDWREVVIGPHRADVHTPDGLVFEMQHSPLSSEEIEARERFYGDMVWVLDARTWRIDVRRPASGLGSAFVPPAPGEYVTFRWKHAHKTWSVATKPMLLDLGPYLLDVRKVHWEAPTGGWGYISEIAASQSR